MNRNCFAKKSPQKDGIDFTEIVCVCSRFLLGFSQRRDVFHVNYHYFLVGVLAVVFAFFMSFLAFRIVRNFNDENVNRNGSNCKDISINIATTNHVTNKDNDSPVDRK